MKAYKLEVLVVDFDEVGQEEMVNLIENARYPNRCISPSVQSVQVADIGEWDDDHPLNRKDTAAAEYKRLRWVREVQGKATLDDDDGFSISDGHCHCKYCCRATRNPWGVCDVCTKYNDVKRCEPHLQVIARLRKIRSDGYMPKGHRVFFRTLCRRLDQLGTVDQLGRVAFLEELCEGGWLMGQDE